MSNTIFEDVNFGATRIIETQYAKIDPRTNETIKRKDGKLNLTFITEGDAIGFRNLLHATGLGQLILDVSGASVIDKDDLMSDFAYSDDTLQLLEQIDFIREVLPTKNVEDITDVEYSLTDNDVSILYYTRNQDVVDNPLTLVAERKFEYRSKFVEYLYTQVKTYINIMLTSYMSGTGSAMKGRTVKNNPLHQAMSIRFLIEYHTERSLNQQTYMCVKSGSNFAISSVLDIFCITIALNERVIESMKKGSGAVKYINETIVNKNQGEADRVINRYRITPLIGGAFNVQVKYRGIKPRPNSEDRSSLLALE